jgi:hypothetical protein
VTHLSGGDPQLGRPFVRQLTPCKA